MFHCCVCGILWLCGFKFEEPKQEEVLFSLVVILEYDDGTTKMTMEEGQ